MEHQNYFKDMHLNYFTYTIFIMIILILMNQIQS